MSQRLDFSTFDGPLFKKYLAFALSFTQDRTLSLLVDIRASQMNGCAFCLDMHVKEAVANGERALRLHHLATWRDSPLFTPKERAALAWTEAVTDLGREGVDDATYALARAQFQEAELVELTFRVVAINGWNRLNVAFRTVPGSKDAAYGLDKVVV